MRICGQLLDRDQRVGHLAIGVERGLLVLHHRLIEPRLRRLVVPLDALAVEERLEEARANDQMIESPLSRSAKVAAHRAERSRQADRRIEERLGRADVGVGRDEQIARPG